MQAHNNFIQWQFSSFRNLRAANAARGFGRNGGKWKFTNGHRSAKIGGKTGGADATAAGTDSEEVKVVVARQLSSIIRLGSSRNVAALALKIKKRAAIVREWS